MSVEIGEGGVYIGRAKVEAMFLQILEPFFTMPGMMPLHMLTTRVIEVEPGRLRAHGMWQQGAYDNLYPKEDERWKILRMRWLANFRTSFDKGWVVEPLYHLTPLDWQKFPPEHRPDQPGSGSFESYNPSAIRQRAPLHPEPVINEG